jgi:hypothetical protein
MRAQRHIELGVKGPADRIDAAFAAMEDGLKRLGARYTIAD